MRAFKSLSLPASQKRSIVEMLERRRLLSVTLGTNLVVNGDAEANVGSASGNDVIHPTGWTSNGTPTVVKYGASGFPSATGPGPANRGKNFFAGGPSGEKESDFFQTIDVSSLAASIDAHQVQYNLAAFIGGFSSQEDDATVFANFQGGTVSQASIGPVSATQRAGKTGLLSRTTQGTIPAGTRKIQVQMHFEAVTGGYIDGYVDNVSVILTSTASVPGSISGAVFADVNGDGIRQTGEAGLANVQVFVDKNKNGIPDLGEPTAKTALNGTYTISGVAAGTYMVREVLPATFRATTPNPLTLTVANAVTTAANFGDSQTVLLSGTVFNDSNGNKTQDATEKGLAGVTVYLDFNNNGQLDSFELKTTTDANGHFKFIVPFGTYVVRQIVPAGKTVTFGAAGHTITLGMGLTFGLLNFGDK